MFKSATLKLTLWYLAIVMIISLAFSFVVYHFATDELSTGLHHQTARIFREFPVFDGNPSLVMRQSNDVAAGEHHILWRLAYFNVLVLVGAGFASYFLARRTLEPIELAHERQARFTADVSHELRTPLTSLKMGSEVSLLDPKADKKALQAALRSNIEDADKMERLINNLLRLTKLDIESAQAAFNDVPLADITAQAASQIANTARAKQITVEIDTSAAHVTGDRDALVQLLVILLDNAIKYSDPATTVNLKTRQENGAVLISIEDHGYGINPAALPHVFDRFFRQDSSRTSGEQAGFGLGLSIAKMIVDRHQGNITLTSRPKNGTTAIVSLPEPYQASGKHDAKRPHRFRVN